MSYEIIKNQEGVIISPKVHKHTLIWIHGLGQLPQKQIPKIIQAVGSMIQNVKIVIPSAPTRFVTVMEKQVPSWFDIKFRGQTSFKVPFDQAFSSKQVIDSYQKVLFPLLKKQKRILDLNKDQGKICVAGFSQGCGMALHCLYEFVQIDAAIGVAGYLFPITNFDKNLNKKKQIIFGLADTLRPWDFVKTTYQGKILDNEITLIEGMKHEINKDTIEALRKFFLSIF